MGAALKKNTSDNIDLIRHAKKFPGELTIIAGNASYLQSKLKEFRETIKFEELKVSGDRLSIIMSNEHSILFVSGDDHELVNKLVVSGYTIGDGTTYEMYEILKTKCKAFLSDKTTRGPIAKVEVTDNSFK